MGPFDSFKISSIVGSGSKFYFAVFEDYSCQEFDVGILSSNYSNFSSFSEFNYEINTKKLVCNIN